MTPDQAYDLAFSIVWPDENGGNFIAVSDNPKDPGQYTRGGIALNRHPELTRAVLDAMTVPEFKDWYRANYWLPNHCDKLAWPVSLVLFDGEINAGGEGAIALQAALGVKPDGCIGQITLSAAAKWEPLELAVRTCIKRDEYYRSLGTFPLFGTGWLKRLFLNIYKAGAASA